MPGEKPRWWQCSLVMSHRVPCFVTSILGWHLTPKSQVILLTDGYWLIPMVTKQFIGRWVLYMNRYLATRRQLKKGSQRDSHKKVSGPELWGSFSCQQFIPLFLNASYYWSFHCPRVGMASEFSTQKSCCSHAWPVLTSPLHPREVQTQAQIISTPKASGVFPELRGHHN